MTQKLKYIAESHGITTRGMSREAILGKIIHEVNELTESEKKTIITAADDLGLGKMVKSRLEKDRDEK